MPSLAPPLTVGAWLRATWYGWLLGVPLVILLALGGEAAGIGGSQVLVGIGMGLGVGLLQARLLRTVLSRPAVWLLSSAVGLAIPFLVTDLAPRFGRDLPYSLPIAVVAGGLIIGVWQAQLLRGHARSPGWWILANAVGWTLAAGMAYLADVAVRGHAIRGLPGALAYLGAVAAGGLLLGVVTGMALPRLLRPVPVAP